MEIFDKKLKEITPYENNPRKNDNAVDAVAASIREFGFKVPIVIDSEGVIVAGHTRYKAAKRLKLKTVPCIVADDLTEEQIKAFRLADNKVGELTEWDFDFLADELADISLDMGQFGFDVDMSLDEEENEVVEDDYNEEPPAEPKSKLGDVYLLGRHRLMCGDSTKREDVEKLIDGAHIHLALTDPPYGIDIVSHNSVGGDSPITIGRVHGNAKNAIMQQTNTYMPIKGDDTTDTAKANYEILKEVCDNLILFGGNYFTDFLPPSRCWAVWDKQNSGTFADAELAWTSFDKVVKLYHFMWNGLIREGSRDVEGVKRIHPTQKPVGLLAKILEDFSEGGENIIDTFGGSGSTLIACEQMSRNCYIMEYEAYYVDVIIDRWEKFTGQKAVKLNADD